MHPTGSWVRVEYDDYLTMIFEDEWFTTTDGLVVRSSAVIAYDLSSSGDADSITSG